ncbi:GDSL-type esterase/lipase family protein [Amycolatopsis granulosa]|uniref:GDSL-type esterase/lipase family protein n=1 Tax=Amycolatopsis granulosa TaxID=185684 RepID=UPI0014219A06|nr:lysophospholipase L1-like esterase [Amycolatopsis granulosa]
MLRTLAVAAVAALTAIGLNWGVAGADTLDYVALGDSYSSGVGAGSYLDSSSCKRSSNAYPELYARQTSAALDFRACSGAKTSDVLSKQVGALSAGTDLVTISVGGNDAGFASVMQDCILGGDAGCKTAIDNAKAFVTGTLPGLLDKTYREIRSRAPEAKVVVLGYPHFYKIGGSCSVGLSDTSRGYIDSGADALDSVIQKEASEAGFAFADVRPAFAGHEICSGASWLHSLTYPVDESYHPTATGQARGYYPSLVAAVRELRV